MGGNFHRGIPVIIIYYLILYGTVYIYIMVFCKRENNETISSYIRLHTLIQNWLPLKRSFNESFKPLHEFFFTPYYMYEPGALDNMAEGLIHENSQGFDSQVTTEMQEHLFQAVDEKFGLDIVSLNLQRGRDHGKLHLNEFY